MKKSNNTLKLVAQNSPSTSAGPILLYNLVKEVEHLKNQQKELSEMAAKAILHALDLKDHYTFGHSMRVAYFSTVVGKEINLSVEEQAELELAALFHDIGKIGVLDSVLLKPNRLNDEEFLAMKEHPTKSWEILNRFPPFAQIALYAKHHHERFDGRGYPDGLKGETIPLFSRIILIADTFDAMTSSRPYREGLPYYVAYDELKQFAGTQFDPTLVKAFISGMEKEEAKGEETFFISLMEQSFQKKAA